MDYSSKYLKYKQKYASLKISKMAGGMEPIPKVQRPNLLTRIIDCYEQVIFTEKNKKDIEKTLNDIHSSFEDLFKTSKVLYHIKHVDPESFIYAPNGYAINKPNPGIGEATSYETLYSLIAYQNYESTKRLQQPPNSKHSSFNFSYVEPFWWDVDDSERNKTLIEDLKNQEKFRNYFFFQTIIKPIQDLKLPILLYDNSDNKNYIENELNICNILVNLKISSPEEQAKIQPQPEEQAKIQPLAEMQLNLETININKSLKENTQNKLNKQMLHLVFVIYCFHLILFFFIRYYSITETLQPPAASLMGNLRKLGRSMTEPLFKTSKKQSMNHQTEDLENNKILLIRLNKLFEENIKPFIKNLLKKIDDIVSKCDFTTSRKLNPYYDKPDQYKAPPKQIARIWLLEQIDLNTIYNLSELLKPDVKYNILNFSYLLYDDSSETDNIIKFIKTKLETPDLKVLFSILSKLINIHFIWNYFQNEPKPKPLKQ